MAGETDDPEDAAARLEAALERIARHAGRARPALHRGVRQACRHDARSGRRSGRTYRRNDRPAPPVEEIAARLDGLIDRLRAACSSSGGRPG